MRRKNFSPMSRTCIIRSMSCAKSALDICVSVSRRRNYQAAKRSE
jgi:hypothetical protein